MSEFTSNQLMMAELVLSPQLFCVFVFVLMWIKRVEGRTAEKLECVSYLHGEV